MKTVDSDAARLERFDADVHQGFAAYRFSGRDVVLVWWADIAIWVDAVIQLA